MECRNGYVQLREVLLCDGNIRSIAVTVKTIKGGF